MKKVLLVILDGFGEAPEAPGNAIANANTPNLDKLRQEFPFGILQASGEAVGLPAGNMGGSEVGHFIIGAGREVPQYLLNINRDIESGEFFKKEAYVEAMEYAKKNDKKMHLLGLLSDKGVHAHIDHLFALLKMAKQFELTKVYVHALADGRDVRSQSVKKYIKMLQDKMDELGVGKLATVIGRYYTMDRDTNWERTEKGYRLMTKGEGVEVADPNEGVDHYYSEKADINDQYLGPILVDKEGLLESEDVLIYYNFRTDRTRQLCSALVDPDFSEFERTVTDVHLVCTGPYSEYAPVVYGIPTVNNNLAEWLSSHNVKQLRVAETEKYAHLTYFFNSQVEHAKPLEERIHIPTPKIKTHDEKPELASREITEAVVDGLNKSEHPVIIANFANIDLLGHTGIYDATVKGMEYVDEALGKIYEAAMKNGYTLMLTGDHGNGEEMFFEDGSVRASHTTNPVILLIADPNGEIKEVKDGGLSDMAPTLLKILGMEKPEEMTGKELI